MQYNSISAPLNQTIENIARDNIGLPAIQRDFVWKPRQVVALFESLVVGYPIGAIMQIESGDPESKGALQPMRFSVKKQSEEPTGENKLKHLVLDGQQRLTAAYILARGYEAEIYASNSNLDEYFINLDNLNKELDNAISRYIKFNGEFDGGGAFLEDSKIFKKILSYIDWGSVIEKSTINFDPAAQIKVENLRINKFKTKNLLWTGHFYEELLNQKENEDGSIINDFSSLPDRIRSFIKMLAKENIFSRGLSTINIEHASISEIVRTFENLNTKSTQLKPIELAYSLLLAQSKGQVNIKKDFAKNKERSPIYRNLEGRNGGMVLLQTIAAIENEPTQIKMIPEIFSNIVYDEKNSEQAFNGIVEAGQILSDNLGLELQNSGSMMPFTMVIPYISACVVSCNKHKCNQDNLKKAIVLWIVSAALERRYSEGALGKLPKDRNDIETLATDFRIDNLPDWVRTALHDEGRIKETLRHESTKGAIANVVKGILLRDLKNHDICDFYSGTSLNDVDVTDLEFHHLLPKNNQNVVSEDCSNYVDVLPNMVWIGGSSNNKIKTDSPHQQINKASGDEESVKAALEGQHVPLDNEIFGGALFQKAHIKVFLDQRTELLFDGVLKQYTDLNEYFKVGKPWEKKEGGAR